MNPRRHFLAALGLAALSAPLRAVAQQPPKIPRIGFLAGRTRSTASNPDVNYDAFIEGMRELGYVEGKNLIIEWRFADGYNERLPGLAAELVRSKVDLIATHSTAGTQAAQRATATIPIVTAGAGDPVGSGFAASLARPGGNVTGLSNIIIDLSPKQIELLKIFIPRLNRVAFLMNPDNPFYSSVLQTLRASAKAVGASVSPVGARSFEEAERGIAMMRQQRVEAVILTGDNLFYVHRRQLAELFLKARIPSMLSRREIVVAGGLMSYGPDTTDSYRRAATYVDKILKGANPGELPFEQPTRFYLTINNRTAKAFGLVIPPELRLRADEVIE